MLSRTRARKRGAVRRVGVRTVCDISPDVSDIFAVVTVAGGMAPISRKALGVELLGESLRELRAEPTLTQG